jgi:cell division protease FtsH
VEERRIVSYHEIGHALLSALQNNAEPVQKITIIPRTMGALGYVMNVPEEEKYLNTKKELEAQIVMALGGRAAEEIVFDTVTTGAANDIEKATKIARAMITQFGMSEKFGLIGLVTQENQYLDGRTYLNCGDATATEIDHEVMLILKKSYAEALRMLREHRSTMDRLAEYLIQRETITGKEFMKIFREVEGIPETDESVPRIEGRITDNGDKAETGSPAPRRERPMNPDGTPRRRPRRPMMNPDGTPRRRPVRRPAPEAGERSETPEQGTVSGPEGSEENPQVSEEETAKKQIMAVPNPDAPMIDLVKMESEEKKTEEHEADEIPVENKAEQI